MSLALNLTQPREAGGESTLSEVEFPPSGY
jgi:uncharacterized membrane protein YfcA